jgi:hypothetical protein
MGDRSNTRIVYSAAAGRVCRGCGWPERDCKCSKPIGADEAVPARVVAELRMELRRRVKQLTALLRLALLCFEHRASAAMAEPARMAMAMFTPPSIESPEDRKGDSVRIVTFERLRAQINRR